MSPPDLANDTEYASKYCTYFNTGRCNSCALIDQPYSQSLTSKEATLLSTFSKEALRNCSVNSIVAADPVFGSRMKAKLLIGGICHKGKVQSINMGLSDAELRGKDVSACPLHFELISQVVTEAKVAALKFNLIPYDIKQRSGEFKYLLMRYLPGTEKLILRFVARSEELLSNFKEAGEYLHERFKEIDLCSLNLQPIAHSIIEGPDEKILFGGPKVTENFGSYSFHISPQSFAQVTPNVALKLYQYVAEKLRQASPQYLLDLFCGGGYFSIFAAPFVKRGLGVESSSIAIDDAVSSARANNFSALSFVAADVDSFLSGCAEHPDLIIINPPRRGLSESICKSLLRVGAQTIVYSSCNVQTLAKDIRWLSDYELVEIQPFDMFPLTEHFESVAILKKRP